MLRKIKTVIMRWGANQDVEYETVDLQPSHNRLAHDLPILPIMELLMDLLQE